MTTPEPVTSVDSRPRSRRALLAGALAGVGAAVARAAAGPLKVRAAGDDGQAVTIGTTYGNVQSQTTLGNQANAERVLWVASNADLGAGNGVAVTGFSAKNVGVEGWSGTWRGVWGHSTSNDGVVGSSDSGYGVRGDSTTFHGIFGRSTRSSGGYGVHGESTSSSNGAGVRGFSATTDGVVGESTGGTGVSGWSSSGVGVRAQSSGSIGLVASGITHAAYGSTHSTAHAAIVGRSLGNDGGVIGYSGGVGDTVPSSASKTGVYGAANQGAGSRGVWGRSQSGSGVYGSSPNGYALRGSGRVRFDKVSGVATIPAGSTSKTIALDVNVTSSSFALLTPRSNLGGRDLWYTVNATANSITIRISSARSSNTAVAWLLVG